MHSTATPALRGSHHSSDTYADAAFAHANEIRIHLFSKWQCDIGLMAGSCKHLLVYAVEKSWSAVV